MVYPIIPIFLSPVLNCYSLGERKSALNPLLFFEQPDTYLDGASRYPQSELLYSLTLKVSPIFLSWSDSFYRSALRAPLRTPQKQE